MDLQCTPDREVGNLAPPETATPDPRTGHPEYRFGADLREAWLRMAGMVPDQPMPIAARFR